MKEMILNDSNDQSNTNQAAGNKNFNITQVLKSTLCNYSDTLILVRSYFTIIGCNNATRVAF